MRTRALESILTLNNLSPAYLNDLLTFKNHSYQFRHQRTVEISQVRTVKQGSRSFRSTLAKIWNSLPWHLRDISSAGGPVHVHSVMLVEMCLPLSLFSCNFFYTKFSYFLANTYVVGTQKNYLNETVLLSNQNTC